MLRPPNAMASSQLVCAGGMVVQAGADRRQDARAATGADWLAMRTVLLHRSGPLRFVAISANPRPSRPELYLFGSVYASSCRTALRRTILQNSQFASAGALRSRLPALVWCLRTRLSKERVQPSRARARAEHRACRGAAGSLHSDLFQLGGYARNKTFPSRPLSRTAPAHWPARCARIRGCFLHRLSCSASRQRRRKGPLKAPIVGWRAIRTQLGPFGPIAWRLVRTKGPETGWKGGANAGQRSV